MQSPGSSCVYKTSRWPSLKGACVLGALRNPRESNKSRRPFERGPDPLTIVAPSANHVKSSTSARAGACCAVYFGKASWQEFARAGDAGRLEAGHDCRIPAREIPGSRLEQRPAPGSRCWARTCRPTPALKGTPEAAESTLYLPRIPSMRTSINAAHRRPECRGWRS